jgi:hypothetical protein
MFFICLGKEIVFKYYIQLFKDYTIGNLAQVYQTSYKVIHLNTIVVEMGLISKLFVKKSYNSFKNSL